MTKSNPRLLLRKHTYYVRVAIPRELQRLTKYKEVRRSLNTKDYFTALNRLRAVSYQIDLFIEFLKGLDMEIRNRRVILTDIELDQVLSYRLRVIEDFIENNYYKIKADKCHYEDIGLFTETALAKYNEACGATFPDEMSSDTDDWDFRWSKFVFRCQIK